MPAPFEPLAQSHTAHHVTGEIAALSASGLLSDRELETLPVNRVVEVVRDLQRGLLVQLSAYMAGLLKERIVIHERWPADWWQAFRERWFPAWWLSRWPVQYRNLDIDERQYLAICPHLHVDPPHKHVEWFYMKQKEADDA